MPSGNRVKSSATGPSSGAGQHAVRQPAASVTTPARAAATRHVILQSSHGPFGSQGVFEPIAHEAADGADTVARLRRRPWFTGRFGTIGMSYLETRRWASLQDPPPQPAAAVIIAGPHGFSALAWRTGSFAVHDLLGWSDLVAHQEDGGLAPVVELTHTSDNPHVDVFVRVSEVDARGRSRNVRDGCLRLPEASQNISTGLDAIAHRFRAGTRIRVLIAGGSHPRYARNLGADEPPLTGTALKPATQAVHFDTSRLVFPVPRHLTHDRPLNHAALNQTKEASCRTG